MTTYTQGLLHCTGESTSARALYTIYVGEKIAVAFDTGEEDVDRHNPAVFEMVLSSINETLKETKTFFRSPSGQLVLDLYQDKEDSPDFFKIIPREGRRAECPSRCWYWENHYWIFGILQEAYCRCPLSTGLFQLSYPPPVHESG